MVNTIIIDFGGVLGTDADTIFIVTLSKHGISQKAAMEIWDKHWPKMGVGDEHVESIWKTVKKRTTSDIKKVIADYNGMVHVNNLMIELCKKIKKKGYKMGVLANETFDWMNIKREKGKLNEVFDAVFSSADLKSLKPLKNSYMKILKSLKARPEEALFIDDRKRNVEAANALGMKGLVFRDIVQLKKDLSKVNII